MSPHCDGAKATCAWGGCLECDRIERVWVNVMTGRTVRAQIRPGDTTGTWLYRLEDWLHQCDTFECGDINIYAADLTESPLLSST